MIRIFWGFVFILVSVLGLEAACPSELITDLNNISVTVENVKRSGEFKSGDLSISKLYSFKPSTNGRLEYDLGSNKDTKFFVVSTKPTSLTPCGGIRASVSLTSSKSSKGFIDVKKDQTVFIRIDNPLLVSGTKTYSLKLDFIVDGFYEDFNDNLNGNIKIIGNSVLLKDGGVCPEYRTTSGWNGLKPDNNANIKTVFANIDNQSGTNSTSAKLELPDNARVVHATLYWQGYFPQYWDWGARYVTNFVEATAKQIKFKQAGSSSYETITSDNRFKKIYTEGWAYQGAADVTSKVTKSGDYFVADLKTQTGQYYSDTGTYGAWALVVVYEHESESYKNVSIYDGFQIVENKTGYNSRPYNLKGFLTPLEGDVNSTFMFFVGEGDIDITGDQVKLKNNAGQHINITDDANPSNNVMNSSVTYFGKNVTTRSPACKNNIGIDIDAFDVGTKKDKNGEIVGIIGNKQTETTVTLTSSGDKYFPGVFAFATDLYKPDVCYTAMRVFEVDKEDPSKTIKELNSGAIVDINTTIRVQATIRNKSTDEHAYRVKLSHLFSDISPYRKNTLMLGGSLQTDLMIDDKNDFAYFDESKNRAFFHLGTGATSSEGGILSSGGGESLPISFVRDLNESSKVKLQYQVDYSNHENADKATLNYNDFILNCNTSIGDFVLNVGQNTVLAYEKNRYMLLTKIANSGKATYTINTSSIIGRYDMPYPDLYIDKTPKEALTGSETWVKLGNLAELDEFEVTIPNKAMREARFAYKIDKGIDIVDKDEIDVVIALTGNSFAIRPAKLEISAATMKGFVGDKFEIDSIVAKDAKGNDVVNYNQRLDFNSSFDAPFFELSATTCPVKYKNTDKLIVSDHNNSILAKSSVQFNQADGTGSFTTGKISFDDVGEFNLVLRDNDWTSIDRANSQCIDTLDEVNTPDEQSGKISCDTIGSIEVLIAPALISFSHSAFYPFSYMYDQSPRNAFDQLDFIGTISGFKEVNSTDITKNLHTGCFYPATTTADLNISWDDRKVLIGEDINISAPDREFKTFWYKTDENASLAGYDEGRARFAISANIDREKYNQTKSPVDLNLTLSLNIDSNWLKKLTDMGMAINHLKLDHNHTFYYGRIYAPSRVTSYDNNATINYLAEIYCPAGDCMGKQKSPTLTNWLIADQDSYTSLVTQLEDKAGETVQFQDGNASLSVDQAGLYHHNIPSYLWYGRFVKAYEFDNAKEFNKQYCAYHPCTDVELKRKGDNWGGTGEDADKRRIEADDKTEAKQDPKPRINW